MPTKIITLKYTGSSVAKAEIESGKNFMNVVAAIGAAPSISDLKFLFDAGGASENDFDQAMAQGIDNAVLIVMRGLDESGFLGTKLDLQAMEKEMKARKSEIQKNMEASETSGEVNKA